MIDAGRVAQDLVDVGQQLLEAELRHQVAASRRGLNCRTTGDRLQALQLRRGRDEVAAGQLETCSLELELLIFVQQRFIEWNLHKPPRADAYNRDVLRFPSCRPPVRVPGHIRSCLTLRIGLTRKACISLPLRVSQVWARQPAAPTAFMCSDFDDDGQDHGAALGLLAEMELATGRRGRWRLTAPQSGARLDGVEAGVQRASWPPAARPGP